MIYEVEQKYAIDDPRQLEESLEQLGASFQEPIEQVDRYYNHPARDFACTDEAFRIRSVGQHHCVTYKGPKIDAATKTRQEIEIPLGEGGDIAGPWNQILLALGFRPVAAVKKTRRPGTLTWENSAVEVCFDHVEEVGEYMELELQADESSLEDAKAKLASLTERLHLGAPERRSYLELLLANKADS